MLIDESIYIYMNDWAPYLNLWIAFFFAITIVRICLSFFKKQMGYGSIISELPGLPLTLLHSVAFVKAIESQDIVTALLFAWWGPGFLVTAAWVIYIKVKKVSFDWAPFGLITSIACKVNYVLFMIFYLYFECYEIAAAFSIWIMHDQINLAWFTGNADRTRRITEDYWIFRMGYVLFLFTQFFVEEFADKTFSIILGLSILALWVVSIVKVIRKGQFRFKPDHSEFLRNIAYLSKK